MAIKGAVRFRPDMYRSALETTVANLDASVTPPTGQVVMIAQLVAYDDTVFGAGNTYKPGKPETEYELVILYEESITKELSVFSGMTQAQATAEWTQALTDFKTRVTPAGTTLVRAIRSARMAPPILI